MADHERALRILGPLLAIAVAASIVHYADNYLNYDDFPQATTLPNPSRGLVLGAWFAFTTAGLAGYALFRQTGSQLSLILLAFYSGSGLVGIGHYLVPEATSMPWWRHAHVGFDIVSGAAVLGFAFWVIRGRAATSDA